MNKTMVIVKKELKRFFSDRKLVLQTVIFPGLMIYIMYSFMGAFLFSVPEGEEISVQAVVENIPASMETVFQSAGFEFIEPSNREEQIQLVEDGELDTYIIFPENFDEMTATQQEVAEVEIYFNSMEDNSSYAYEFTNTYLTMYEESLVNVLNINSDPTKEYDFISTEDITGELLSGLLPMLIILFIFSGCMALAPESIAGEKERGTMSTMLVTPLKRSHLALGKVISLSFMSTLAAASSITGVMLALPKLFGNSVDISMSAYSLIDGLVLFGTVLSLLPVIVTGMLLISAYAKNIKEATTAVTPLMLVAIMGAMAPMMVTGEPQLITALIPIYNVSTVIGSLLTSAASVNYVVVSIVANLVYSTVLIIVLNKMLSSEKWMFS